MDGDCGGGVWTTAGDEADTEGGVAMAATPRVSHGNDRRRPEPDGWMSYQEGVTRCRRMATSRGVTRMRHQGCHTMASQRMDGAPRAPPEWRQVTELSWSAPGRHSVGSRTGDWRGSPPSGKSDGGPSRRRPKAKNIRVFLFLCSLTPSLVSSVFSVPPNDLPWSLTPCKESNMLPCHIGDILVILVTFSSFQYLAWGANTRLG
jgi:hypothetical protein